MAASSSAVAETGFFDALKSRAGEIEARWREQTPASAALHQQAQGRLPGGYSRDSVMRSPYPPYIAGAQGGEMTDADGRTLIDFTFNATALPLGHADPGVVAAVSEQMARGSAYAAPTAGVAELAEAVCARLPSAERLRFANSGSEAVMMAIRLARAVTGPSLIVKFEGSYHGA